MHIQCCCTMHAAPGASTAETAGAVVELSAGCVHADVLENYQQRALKPQLVQSHAISQRAAMLWKTRDINPALHPRPTVCVEPAEASTGGEATAALHTQRRPYVRPLQQIRKPLTLLTRAVQSVMSAASTRVTTRTRVHPNSSSSSTERDSLSAIKHSFTGRGTATSDNATSIASDSLMSSQRSSQSGADEPMLPQGTTSSRGEPGAGCAATHDAQAPHAVAEGARTHAAPHALRSPSPPAGAPAMVLRNSRCSWCALICIDV
jgi:hypothetical protein